jgi:hypothetical protein
LVLRVSLPNIEVSECGSFQECHNESYVGYALLVYSHRLVYWCQVESWWCFECWLFSSKSEQSVAAVKETSATFSYQYDLAKANTTFRGKHKRQANYIIESNDHRIEAIRHVSIDCKTS